MDTLSVCPGLHCPPCAPELCGCNIVSGCALQHSRVNFGAQICTRVPRWASPNFVCASVVCASPRPVVRQHPHEHGQSEAMSSSAKAVLLALEAAASPRTFEFSQRMDCAVTKGLFSGPSPDFLELCREQLAICDRFFNHSATFTVFIRSAESYRTRKLELRRIAAHPEWAWQERDESPILECSFGSIDFLRSSESALLKREVVALLSINALVLPMIKDFFLVGILVIQSLTSEVEDNSRRMKIRAVRPEWPPRFLNSKLQQREDANMSLDIKDSTDRVMKAFSKEQKEESKKIARSLAIACVLDQRTLLLQQSTWQRGVRIGDLLEKVRGPLMAIRTLGKMLQPQLKSGEIARDILDDIMVQGERMKEVVQQFQDVIYFGQSTCGMVGHKDKVVDGNGVLEAQSTKAPEASESENVENLAVDMADDIALKCEQPQLNPVISVGHSRQRDEELPMPPVALAAVMESKAQSCDVSRLLVDLVGMGAALAHKTGQILELKEDPEGAPFLAAIDEPLLRQAFSNLLESSLQHTLPGGWVKVEIKQAPGGGVLVVIIDNGLDLSFMSQAQALAPLGSGLGVEVHASGNAHMALSIGAELTVAQDILEQCGSVLRITSPFLPKASSGTGGTQLEVWLPAPIAKDCS